MEDAQHSKLLGNVSYRLKKPLLLTGLMLVLLALPVTVLLSRQTQDFRQQAAQICEASPADIVLAIDASPSMLQEEKFVKAKAAANSFIDTTSQNTENRIALVAYSNPISTTVVSSFTNDFPTLKTQVDNLVTVGGTCISCAVQKVNQAISQGKRQDIKNVAIILTDGQANQIISSTPYTTVTADVAEAEALELVKQGFEQNNTVFFTIGLGSNQIDPVSGTGVNEAFLKEIASTTGGKYYHAPTGDQLNQIYQEISEIAGKGIISGFIYNDADRNGEYSDTEEKLPNWQVTLSQNDTAIEQLSTDDEGAYSFTGLCDGEFKASVTVQSQWEAISPQNGTINITIVKGSAENETNFGLATRIAACGSSCTQNSECTAASDGCTLCNTITNKCEKPASCGSQCANSSDCANASGGCNVCNPTTNTCQTPPACGSTCSQDSDCAATADSCTVCNQSTNTCSPPPQDTVLKIQAKMPGIGGQSGDNQNPQNPTRDAVIEIYNTQNQLINDGGGTAQFQGENYVGEVNLGEDFVPGIYYAKIGLNNTLVSRVPQVHNLQKGIINELPAVTLLPGDLNQNNILDLLDYNIFISCFGDKTCDQKILADLNDDGEVEGIDYNILLRAYQERQGSSQ